MTKSLLTLLLSLLFASHVSALVECYDLPTGVNGKGSTHVVKLSPITSAYSVDDRLELTFRNDFYENLNVKVRFYDANGNAFSPSTINFAGQFSGTNNPVANSSGSGAAFLAPNKIGVAKVFVTSVNTYSVELSWQADQCLPNHEGIITTSVLHGYVEDGNYIKRVVPIYGF